MKALIIAILVAWGAVLAPVGCSKPKVVEADKLHERNGLAYEINSEDPFTGTTIERWPIGMKKEEIDYRDGELQGKYRTWAENGKSLSDLDFYAGKTVGGTWVPEEGVLDKIDFSAEELLYDPVIGRVFTGTVVSFHSNGQKEAVAEFSEGKLHGKMVIWYENGQKMVEGEYRDGKLHGKIVGWYKNGQKMAEGEYRDGKLYGKMDEGHNNDQNPSQEFASGKQANYSTAKHPKANGVNLSIKYPTSWMAKEGERPHIVQKFISNGGLGDEYVLIIVKPLPVEPGTSLPEAQLKEIFSLDQLKYLIPPEAIYISVQQALIEGLPAGIIEYSISHDRLGTTVNIQVLTYVFIWKSNIIKLQCSVGSASDQIYDVSKRMQVLKPLFCSIANSIVLHDKWDSASDLKLTYPTPPIEHSRRYYEHAGGFSYCLPVGWSLFEFPGSKYKIAHGPVSGVDVANIVFVDENYRGSLNSYVVSSLSTLRELTPGLRILNQSSFRTDSGNTGIKVAVESVQMLESVQKKFNYLRILYYFNLDKDTKLIITCRCLASESHKYNELFNNIVNSLVISL